MSTYVFQNIRFGDIQAEFEKRFGLNRDKRVKIRVELDEPGTPEMKISEVSAKQNVLQSLRDFPPLNVDRNMTDLIREERERIDTRNLTPSPT